MTKSLRALVLAPVALTLVLAGCGDDDDGGSAATAADAPTETTEAGEDFVEALDELCAQGDEASTAAGEDFDEALQAVSDADQSGDDEAYQEALDDAETAAEDILDALDEFESGVEELDVPPEAEEPLQTYLDALTEQRGAAEDLRDAIAADDGAAFNAALEELEAGNEESEEIRLEAAQELGAPECEPDSAGDAEDEDDTEDEDDSESNK